LRSRPNVDRYRDIYHPESNTSILKGEVLVKQISRVEAFRRVMAIVKKIGAPWHRVPTPLPGWR